VPASDDAADKAAKPDLEPSVRGQFGRTRSSFGRLISAHLGLLRAEISEIVGQLKMMATLGGIVLALLLTMANMLYIGGFLFIGEWLFGSIGWGLAHGTLFALGLALVLVLAIVGASRATAILSFAVATLLTIGLALLLGSNLAYTSAANVAAQLAAPVNSASAVAIIAGVVIVGVLFALMLARVGGRSGAVGGLVLGAFLGIILGFLIGGAPWTWPPAMGFAITIGLIAWPIINFVLAWPKLDVGKRFSQLYPKQTIETVTESREWLENQWRSRLPKLGKK
jgi:hypothetical protein